MAPYFPHPNISGSTPRQTGALDAEEIHPGEAVEEKVSLSDRFGLWISFYAFNQEDYLQAASFWVNKLARDHGLDLTGLNDGLEASALHWALQRGHRSGRVAFQFARDWVGKRKLVPEKDN